VSEDDFDRILSEDEQILPSSGFVASVIEAVRLEAVTPQPIPFPWSRVLPGLVAAILLLAGFVLLNFKQLVRVATAPSSVEGLSLDPGLFLRPAVLVDVGWIFLALLLTFSSLMLSRLLAGART
jgi:hypothetical protein